MDIGMTATALTLSLSTTPLKAAPQGGLANLPAQPLPIAPFTSIIVCEASVFTLCFRETARCFDNRI